MDIETLLKNLEHEVSCSMCLEIFKDPKQLPCLHSFCLACLNHLASSRAENGKIKCPVCTRETAVPECGTLESLPCSFYLNGLLEVLATKRCDTSKVSCGNCDRTSQESSYCFECGKFWCQQCLIGHNILRENQDHRVVGLKDFRTKDFEEVIKRPVFCAKDLHNDVLKFYCMVCNVAVCQSCLNVEHNGHGVDHLEKTAQEEASKIMAEMVKAEKLGADLDEGIERIKKRSVDIKRCVDAVKKDTCDFVEASIRSLHKHKEELIAEAESLGRSSQEKLDEEENQIQARLKKLSETVKHTENLVKRGTNVEIVQSTGNVKRNFEELFDCKNPDLHLKPSEEANFVFSGNEKFFERLKSNDIGEVKRTHTKPDKCKVKGKGHTEAFAGLKSHCVVITNNEQSRKRYTRGDRVRVQLKCETDNEDCVVDAEIEDNKDGTYKASFLVKEPGKYDMSVMVNEEPVQGLDPFTTVQVNPREFKAVLSVGREGTYYSGRFKPLGSVSQ